MLRIIFITCLTAFSIIAYAQNGRASKKHIGCYIPPYRPKGDKHENCKNNSGRQGVWNFYSYSGFLFSQLGYKDDKVVWSIVYYADTKHHSGEVKRKLSGTPPDSILNPKKKSHH
jgi:hypothetical protein